ncbi:MAG: EAL domain-containing protein [Pseudomonadota bacterium]
MNKLPELLNTKILVVDDSADNAAMLSDMLRLFGYQVVDSACDPAAVCAMHAAQRYDLILLDMNMPLMNGFDVMQALHSERPDQCPPVLAISADPAYKVQALRAGARDFLCRPLDPDELQARVRNLLEHQIQLARAKGANVRLNTFDELTGMADRSAFFLLIERCLSRPAPHKGALFMLELEGLRRVSDTLGFQVGDQLLGEFAARLVRNVPADSLLGRMGTDEFAVYATIDGRDEADGIALLINQCCDKAFCLGGHEFKLAISIGIALHPGDGSSPDSLVRCAGTALQQARQGGGGTRRFYQDTMDAQALQRFDYESALAHACANGEFSLHYQPKIDLATGRMASAEALLRWNRPGHDSVPPAEFIPILEETGLIVEVGAWVINEACRQMAAWRPLLTGPMHIAVNVASRQFTDGNLAVDVAQALARHGLSPDMLGLEVTETALMNDTSHTAAVLAYLRDFGLHIAIDDFGTGHSSLAYLKHFAIDTLKIDRAFVRDATTNPGDAALVVAMIELAHSLGMNVVAEGVETAEQWSFLQRRHCDQVQGYYFSRPLPADDFEHLLRAGASMAPAQQAPDEEQRTILLVDDEPHVLAALERLLRMDGYTILTAGSGEQALDVLARHPVQLILCDQRMDGMSGVEFFDRVKDIHPQALRIILSGYAEFSTVMEAINRGAAYRFLTKPWDNHRLRDEVAAAFRHVWHAHPGAAVAPALP